MLQKMNFGFLKEIISDRIGSQKELAERLGLSLTSLGNKLNNRVDFTYDEIFKIKVILSLSEEETYRCFFIAK